MADENPYAPPQADLTVSSPETVDRPLALAGRGLRLVGAIIDGVIAMVVTFPLMFVFGVWETAIVNGLSFGQLVMVGLMGAGIFMLIHGYLLAKHGQTVGKHLVGTRIVSVTDGKILPFGRVIALRYLPLWVISQVPILGALFSLADALFVFRDDRRCVHDLIAGTKVVGA